MDGVLPKHIITLLQVSRLRRTLCPLRDLIVYQHLTTRASTEDSRLGEGPLHISPTLQ